MTTYEQATTLSKTVSTRDTTLEGGQLTMMSGLMTPPTFESWQAGGRRFSHRNHQIFWQASGAGGGETLICIHGFPTASWDWHALWPALCQRFSRVIALDMIGFGWSDKPDPYPYSIFDQADLHESLLLAEGVTRCHILAHDYGVTVAQELLARHEQRRAAGDPSLELQSVCLLNGGLFPETHRARLAQKLLLTPLGPLIAAALSERDFSRSFSALFGKKSKPDAVEMNQFWQLFSNGRGKRIAPRLLGYIAERRAHRERWVGALQAAQVPLRLINGPVDPVSGEHMVRRFRELVPQPDTVLLPDVGHYPQVEDPTGVLAAFMEFHCRIATPDPATCCRTSKRQE
jgi:pimeloyl-ACP methyl ester carboxylesterase